jgi:tRNA (guanosine-2'-O-)-methyltransferase
MARQRDEIDELIDRHGPDVVVAAMRPLLSDDRIARIEEVLDSRLTGLTVVLENLYDPHNGAAALRSVEGFGLSALHVVEAAGSFRAAPQVTIGCEKWVDLHRHADVAGAAAALAAAGMTMCATVPGAGATVDDLPPLERVAFWFGNEHEGLSAAALAACTRRVEIPMFGMTRSFNLSVSVALVMSRAAERRRAALGRPGELAVEDRAKRRARWYAQDIRGAAEIISRHVSAQTRPERVSAGDQDRK